jgi:hypothetical protein
MNYTENLYNYIGKQFLEQNIDHYINNSIHVNICGYQINHEGKYPFLSFLLNRNSLLNSSFIFPYISINKFMNSDNIITTTKLFLFDLLTNKCDYDKFNDNITFDGFYIYKNEIYIFYNLTNDTLVYNNIYNNEIFFAIVDEIINHKAILNIPIDNNVYEFFMDNVIFTQLYNKSDEICEMPIICYVGKNYTMLNFTCTFGVSIKENGILGPYFYFTNFKNAVREGCWSEDGKSEIKYGKLITNNEYGRYVKGGIVRIALFLGNTKYIENNPNDEYDKSEIKKQRLIESNIDQTLERLTMRITDYDGLWAEKYDSVYLGKLELDNGDFLKNTPVIVAKNYNQQVPLSSHCINTKCLQEKYDEKQKYYIDFN